MNRRAFLKGIAGFVLVVSTFGNLIRKLTFPTSVEYLFEPYPEGSTPWRKHKGRYESLNLRTMFTKRQFAAIESREGSWSDTEELPIWLNAKYRLIDHPYWKMSRRYRTHDRLRPANSLTTDSQFNV